MQLFWKKCYARKSKRDFWWKFLVVRTKKKKKRKKNHTLYYSKTNAFLCSGQNVKGAAGKCFAVTVGLGCNFDVENEQKT